MIKAVIFDLDGLLVDTEKLSYIAYKKFLQENNYDFSLETYAQYYSGHTEEDNCKIFLKNYNLDYDLESLTTELSDRLNITDYRLIDLKPGALELIQFLKKHDIKIALATSSTLDRAKNILEHNGLSMYFDDFVCSEDTNFSKPDPDVFLIAASKLKEHTDNCLVLEDSEAGIEAAYRAKIKVICIPDMKKPGKEYEQKCTNIFDSLLRVIDYIKEENAIL